MGESDGEDGSQDPHEGAGEHDEDGGDDGVAEFFGPFPGGEDPPDEHRVDQVADGVGDDERDDELLRLPDCFRCLMGSSLVGNTIESTLPTPSQSRIMQTINAHAL